jgi:hypothetical protein
MKRWFIARMVEIAPDEWAPQVAAHAGVNWRAWSKDGFGFALGQLAASDLTAIAADPDIKLIPDAALDNTLNSLSSATRTALTNNLAAAGFDIAAVRNTWTVRRLLQHLKLQLQADNDVDAGAVPEPA